MSLSWNTPAGLLFTATQAETVNLSVSASGNNVTYKVISGNLPAGLILSSTGTITGNTVSVVFPTTSTFVVRATDNNNSIKDRTFKIYQEPLHKPTWHSTGFDEEGANLTTLLINREHVDRALHADLTDNSFKISYKITAGRLPHGLKLDKAGRIYGNPKLLLDPGYVREFPITLSASDGYLESTQSFVLRVLDTDSFTVDSTALVIGTDTNSLIDLSLEGTASLGLLQLPEFLSGSNLGQVYADNNHYIPVTAFDPNPKLGPIIYNAVDELPPNLELDPKVGYLYGNIPAQNNFLHRYSFRINATKYNSVTSECVTATNTFTLGIIGNNRQAISWNTDAGLGTITEGITSELSISATTTDAFPLIYQVYPGSDLPAGLELMPSGNIVGSASTGGAFTFTLLASTGTYTSQMLTSSVLPTAFSTQTFNLNVIPVSEEYTSIYVQPMLSPSKQNKWETFINNESIFLPSLIYRADDPAFGIQSTLKMFLEFGIEKVNIEDYATVLHHHFYKRLLTFGTVKSAVAKDASGTHLYDVIYVDVIDEIDGAKSAVTINGQVYYPGSIGNMRDALAAITLADQSVIKIDDKYLPRFMQVATGGNYMKVAILCYTLPGQASKILGRIRASDFEFRSLDFTVDRLTVQNSLNTDGPTYLVFNNSSITGIN